MWVFAQAAPDVRQFITDPPIALLFIFLTIAVAALATGRGVVPRFLYDREKERADEALKGLASLTGVVKDLTDEIRSNRRNEGNN